MQAAWSQAGPSAPIRSGDVQETQRRRAGSRNDEAQTTNRDAIREDGKKLHGSSSLGHDRANLAFDRTARANTTWACCLNPGSQTGPNGRSRQAAPVLRFQRQASKTLRKLVSGRPVLAGEGKTSLIRSHCASESACRGIRAVSWVNNPWWKHVYFYQKGD